MDFPDFGDICKCFNCGSPLYEGQLAYVLHCGHLLCYPRCIQEDRPGSQKFRCPICQESKQGYNEAMSIAFDCYRRQVSATAPMDYQQFLGNLNFMLVPCHRDQSHDTARCVFDHSQYGKSALTRDLQKANFVTIMFCNKCKVRGPDSVGVCPRCKGKLTAKQVPPLTRVEKVKVVRFPYGTNLSKSDEGTQQVDLQRLWKTYSNP